MGYSRVTVVAIALALSACASSEEPEEDDVHSTDALVAPSAGGISFGHDGKEKIQSVPIQDKASSWSVVYSVSVDALRADERLAVRGEVTLSKCVPSEDAPCKRVTPFDPKFTAKIVLGDSASDVSGASISKDVDTTCNTREHHCTLVIPEAIGSRLVPATAKGKFVNLVVAAEGKGANGDDRMKVESQHGGVYVTRLGAGSARGGNPIALDDVSGGAMKIDNVDDGGDSRRESKVTFRGKLGVRPGDVLDVDGLIVAKVDDGACDPLIMNQVFVSTEGTGDPEKTKLLELTAQNGTNCLDSSCTYKKSGAGELPKDAPATVWVTVVSKAGRSCAQPGDKWQIGAGSKVTVGVRR